QKPFKKLPGSRRSAFETIDQPALQALPEHPYVYAEWKKVRVHILCGQAISVAFALLSGVALDMGPSGDHRSLAIMGAENPSVPSQFAVVEFCAKVPVAPIRADATESGSLQRNSAPL
ncbi:MAG: hypothetical protein ABIO21_09620, partial [Pseudomonas sp.]